MPFCVEGALVYSSDFAYHKPCSHNPRLVLVQYNCTVIKYHQKEIVL